MTDSVIGLQRGVVKLVDYNPQWKDVFDAEQKMLLSKFSHVISEISHGGSTAIPGMPAKPIIDMFAIVPSLEAAESIRQSLEMMGYNYRGTEGVPGRILFVKGSEEKRTHHLQLVARNNDEWKNHLLIKNYYLRHPEVARQYAELKRVLAKRFSNNRAAYREGKHVFIQSVIEKAKMEEASLS